MSPEAAAARAGVAFAAASLRVAVLATVRANRVIAVTQRDEAGRLERSHVEWVQDLDENGEYVLTNSGIDAAFDVKVRVRAHTHACTAALLESSDRVGRHEFVRIANSLPTESLTLSVTRGAHVNAPARSLKVEPRVTWRTKLDQPGDADLPPELLPRSKRASRRAAVN